MQPYAVFAYPLITAAIATALPGRGDLHCRLACQSQGGWVTVGQQQHPEWDWPFMATVLWIQRGQVQEEAPRLPAWRRWLRWLASGGPR